MKSRSLQDLTGMRDALRPREAEELARREREREARRQAQAEQELFTRAVGKVQALDHAPRVTLK